MPLAVGNNVQLLCHTLSSFRRIRRYFKPFAGPVAIPRDAARTAENAGSAVLSTSDSMHTTNTRPLQEQLRDQMELHKLQREGIPEDTRTQTSQAPSKRASAKAKREVKTGSKADRSPPARVKNARRRRYRGDIQSDGRFKAALASSASPGFDLAVQEPASAGTGLERKKQRTLTKQEDIALCSAIKVNTPLGFVCTLKTMLLVHLHSRSASICCLKCLYSVPVMDSTALGSIASRLHQHIFLVHHVVACSHIPNLAQSLSGLHALVQM